MSNKLKHIGVVSLLTVVSRVLGLARDTLALAIFGTGEYYSAFVTAFSLPNLFRRLLGEGSLTAAFVPTLQEELHERGRPGAFALLNQVVSWLAVVTGVMVALAMLAFSQSRLLPGHEPRWYLAADLTVLLFPYLALICLAAALNATLNVLERFTEPALSPIWLNLAMILSLGGAGWNLADTELGRMHWLCAGVLAGGCLQLLVPAGVLLRAGWRPRWDLGVSPRVRAIAALMAPGLFGSAIYQINVYGPLHAIFHELGFETSGPNFIPLTKKGKRSHATGRNPTKEGLVRGKDFVMAWQGVTVPKRPFMIPTNDEWGEIGKSIRLGLARILKGRS